LLIDFCISDKFVTWTDEILHMYWYFCPNWWLQLIFKTDTRNLTYCSHGLTLWYKMFYKQLIIIQLFKKFQDLQTQVQKKSGPRHHPQPVLIFTAHFLKNIIPYMFKSFEWSLTLRPALYSPFLSSLT
jgi:hypothetical protein